MNGNKQLSAVERLDAAWDDVEKGISTLGTLIRSTPLNKDALHRYEAYKTALALIAESYVNQVHYDRERPESLSVFGSLLNFAAPAPDFTYHLVHLQPGSSYRVWGRRGDAVIIDFQQYVGWYGQNAEELSIVPVANELFDSQNIKLDAQGNFDFVLGPDQRDGQWWKLDQRATTLLIREYFTDYAIQQRSSTFHFDRLDIDQGNTIPGIDVAVGKIDAFAHSLRDYAYSFSMPQTFADIGNNRCRDFQVSNIGAASEQRYFQARFEVKAGEALVGKWIVPESYQYWGVSLYNDAYQQLDYANRQVNLNNALARMGDDGVFYFVLSHHDPGVANWLDVDGHSQGFVLSRVKGSSNFDLPTMELVPMDEVHKYLPDNVTRITAEQRARDLAVRRRHFQIREGR